MDEQGLIKIIGKNIRRLRKIRGWTQEQLAEKVARQPASISHIETGNTLLGVELLVAMANVLSVSVDELVRPENSTSHFKTITSLLYDQSNEALDKLEPFIQLWISQYGNPTPPPTTIPKLPQELDRP